MAPPALASSSELATNVARSQLDDRRPRESANPSALTLSARDRGPGISEADQKRIFEQFERAAPPAMAGLGLGLWIATRIVEAHGGSIRVESRLGEGASFNVELPLQPPA